MLDSVAIKRLHCSIVQFYGQAHHQGSTRTLHAGYEIIREIKRLRTLTKLIQRQLVERREKLGITEFFRLEAHSFFLKNSGVVGGVRFVEQYLSVLFVHLVRYIVNRSSETKKLL